MSLPTKKPATEVTDIPQIENSYFGYFGYLISTNDMIRKSTLKHQTCSTTLWLCLSKENHDFLIDIQAGRRKKKTKRNSLQKIINDMLDVLRTAAD